ncbi:hypothetical protein SDRG_07473 [Saprolegnia diclina VS20]|uniref:NADH dehydrogenase [ubiquinone] 1 beta subcomplex subunit 2 n=2 Tax=Saprolegnia TaxID=4769 RepID=A0A067BQY7_SAPPC|nr:hypothetical protein SDRG_07473 [Saprolegnia diclina VS20]XP_012210110.1 hypothetical protein SPRG_14786 [Saprolegnia parasitica CBS 223.65]EQC35245.1 hypothetical protein SDRG_07473 [Saprolegnia diclina VS20]KDO19175.1 hypothetical protein SPRG_14786 [Saprolegnia parasitica CBS 223.65]|eukprot:XP_008611529.1 hypothetical protein SDRG_07473 [Saprolegnia diclina VS20]
MWNRVTSPLLRAAHARSMASHGHGHGSYPHGMHFHVDPVHKALGTAFGTLTWLWIFYRAKEDGAVVLGWEHPWDHGHGHGHHDAHAGPVAYEKVEIGERPRLVEE